MRHLGDFPVGGVVDFCWESNAAAGGSITRGTNGTVRVYKNNSATQRASSAGITDSEDFDGLTGIHQLRIDLADNTDAGFYAAGNEYDIVLEGAVIDGQTKNAILAHFSIERAGGILALLKSGTFGLAVTKTRLDLVPLPIWEGTLDAVADGTVEFPSGYGVSTQAQIVVEITQAGAHFGKSRFATYSGTGDVWNVDKAWNADSETTPTGTPTARAFSVPADAVANPAQVDVRRVGGTAQTAGDLAALVTTVDTVVDRIEVDTQDLQARTPAALVSGRMDVSVGAMAANVLTATAIATGAITAAKFAANALDAVWSTATRLLTAGTNIVLAKGTGVTGFNDPTAAANASAVRTELATELARLDVAVSTRLATAGYTAPPSADAIATAVHTTAMTEAYSADGGTVTVAQALYELLALASEFSVSGTTMTVKKRDGSTTALTLALDSASAPTAITRAS